jgi:PAS domain S-box-containing protein
MKERRFSMLIAAAAPVDRAAMRDALSRDPATQYVIIEAESGLSALELRRARKPDCLILDHDLPDLSALEALKILAAEGGARTCAVVVLVGEGDVRLAVEAMESGAHGCIEKKRAGGEELLRAVIHAMEKAERQRQGAGPERVMIDEEQPVAMAAATIGAAAGSRPERADHNRAEEQLRLLKTAIEQSNESVMIMTAQLDPPGPQIVYVNSSFTKMTGYAPEEVIGKTPRILDGPKTDRAMLDRLRKDCAAGKVFHGETIKYRKDGTEFRLEWTAGPVRNERGEVTHFVATQRDVTNRRRVEEELRRRELEFRSLFDLSAIGMAQVSRDYKFIRVNRKFCQMLGYSEQELLGLTFLDVTHPDDREISAAQAAACFSGEVAESHFEKRYVRKDGEVIWALIDWAFIPDAEGRPLRTITNIQDITARKRAEGELRKSEARHASEAKTMRDLYDSSARLQTAPDLQSALEEILRSSVRLMRADFGNIQLYDAERKVLRLAALHGFDEPFVETFRVVSTDDNTGCGRALRSGTRVVIGDVERDELYAPYRKAAAAAEYRSVQSTPLYDREGALLGVLSTHWRAPHRPSEQELLTLDLYARQAIHFIIRARAEEALREAEKRFSEIVGVAEISTNFRALFEASPTPFLVLTPPDFQIIAVNDAFLNATMTRRAEIIGKGLFEAFPNNPDERESTGVRNLSASLNRAIATRRADVMAVQKYDIRLPQSEGGAFVERWWSPINTPMLGADGEVAAIIHRVEDVTEIVRLRSESEAWDQVSRDQQNVIERLRETLDELTREAEIRRRAEEALRESERRTQEHAAELADLHRRKDEFLAMLSHELRNPLSPILNAAHILRLQKDENPLQQQARAVIERQVNQLSRLVNDLLEVSRVITGTIRLHPERLEMRDVVEQAVESARPLVDERRHQLFVSLPVEPVWLEGDAARLEQIVVNLLNNAAKYTDEGGKIWVNLQPEGSEVMLRVRDTGVGIAPELLSRIFDLFTQADRSLDRSQGGLGIGLSLTQRLVELHRGKIEAHSAGLRHGSEFIVRLPVFPSSEMEADMTSGGTSKQAAQGWRVLVVDDNVDAANMIAMMLQHFGHQTETVYSAQSALEMAVKYHPDFVVLDIGLPGMDGYEVARRLRRIPELKDTRLIAATGYGQEADRQRSEEAGFDYHLVKPIDPQILQTALELPGRLPRSAKSGNITR